MNFRPISLRNYLFERIAPSSFEIITFVYYANAVSVYVRISEELRPLSLPIRVIWLVLPE